MIYARGRTERRGVFRGLEKPEKRRDSQRLLNVLEDRPEGGEL